MAFVEREIPEPNASGEHPLQTSWTFWYEKKLPRGSPPESYKTNIKPLGTFDTVQSFWRHYVYLKRPSELPKDTNYYLFRERAVPMWETFPDGGCWILKIRRTPESMGFVSKMWQDLVFAAIGEVFEEPDMVGVVLAVRSKECYLAVWNRDNSNERIRFIIGERLKEVLQLDSTTIIEYKAHRASIQDGSTFRNAQAFVFAQRPRSSSRASTSSAGARRPSLDSTDGPAALE